MVLTHESYSPISPDTAMPISIIHIGLPLDHPSIPAEDRPMLAKRLAGLRQGMRDAGYDYEILHASPDTGLEAFRDQLRTQSCHGVLIGGGVVGNPELTYFMEQIVNTAHEFAPQAKILFFSHSVDVRTTVQRWLPAPSG
jgi:hypothetical protein